MKPNILIIMTDQQQAGLRKGAGYVFDTMPNLDRFANEGTDFACAYTPNPTCSPARTSLFTGRYPSAHRVRTNHNLRDVCFYKDLITVLREQGYATALCGKNHSYMNAAKYFDFHAENDHLGNEYGKDRPESDGLQKKFNEFLKSTKFIDCETPSPFPVSCQQPYRNASSFIRFLDSLGSDKPFFAWVSFAEPHNPYQVPKPYFDMFPPADLPKLESADIDLSEKGERFAWLKGVWDEVIGTDKSRIARMRSNYLGMLRLIDDQFGRILDSLEERKLDKNTIVIYMSDHGDFVGEYGMMRKGVDLPDVLTRIPMIWRGPGIAPQGRVNDCFVNIVDVMPTICRMLGVEIPLGVQGQSICGLLDGTADKEQFNYAYSESGFGGLYWTKNDCLDLCEEGACHKRETFDCLNSWTQCGSVRMVVKGDYKLQADMMGNYRLYNLKNDRSELKNLWGKVGYEDISLDMLKTLTTALIRTNDPLPPPHHRYRIKRSPDNSFRNITITEDPGVTKADYAGINN